MKEFFSSCKDLWLEYKNTHAPWQQRLFKLSALLGLLVSLCSIFLPHTITSHSSVGMLIGVIGAGSLMLILASIFINEKANPHSITTWSYYIVGFLILSLLSITICFIN